MKDELHRQAVVRGDHLRRLVVGAAVNWADIWTLERRSLEDDESLALAAFR